MIWGKGLTAEARTGDVKEEQTEKTELRANDRIMAGQNHELNARIFAQAAKTFMDSSSYGKYKSRTRRIFALTVSLPS